MDSALGLIELTDSEAAAIQKLPREEVGLLAPTKAYARLYGDDAARRQGGTAPNDRTKWDHAFTRSSGVYVFDGN
jgi:hypothetical protein